jgi:hypothetical protein
MRLGGDASASSPNGERRSKHEQALALETRRRSNAVDAAHLAPRQP